MYQFNYQDPMEQQRQKLGQLSEDYAPQTDFGRVSMGQAPVEGQGQAPVEQQADAASTMNQANVAAAEDIGSTVQAEQAADPTAFQYTSQGATDTEALGEGMFAFGLKLLAASSREGADFGGSMAEAVAAGAPAFANALNRQKRFENKEALEAKGFTQESIDAYISSGNNKDLIKGEGPKNFIKTKEVDGRLYQYDERDPASSMKLVQDRAKKLVKTVDLGNQVELHYDDNTMEVRSKGMSPDAAARASGGGGGGRGGSGKADWKTELFEYQDPETGEFQTISATFNDKAHPSEREFYNEQGVPIKLPQGAKMTSEAQQISRSDKRYKAQDEAVGLANTIQATTSYTKDLLGEDANWYRVDRFIPYTDEANKYQRLENAKSNLMVNTYSNMSGVAGASVQTEKALLDSIPGPTADPKTKAEWARRKLSYDNTVLEATIRQQERRYGQVDPSLRSALKDVQQQRSSVDSYLKGLGKEKGSTGRKGDSVLPGNKSAVQQNNKPSAFATPMVDYGKPLGEAKQQKSTTDYSGLW